VAVLGHKVRQGGALKDMFDEGKTSRTIAEAYRGLRNGVDLDQGQATKTTREGKSTGVDIGPIETDGAGPIEMGEKSEAVIPGDVEPETPEIEGQLTEAEITNVMRRQVKALRDCYERALKRDHGLAGKLVVKFEVEASGRTDSITFEDDSLHSDDVKSCIARRAKTWHFPKPEGGGSVFVAYPLVFAKSGF
jgi:hypothetical protein